MPDYFSHAICAQKILESCKLTTRSRITDRNMYQLGAQGGDVFFAYKLNFNQSNLGKRLHFMPAVELFDILKEGDLSYACGFATHYALDCTLHPAVYAFESSSKVAFAHMRFESDLGLFISRKYAVTRRILPRESVLGATFAVYDAISKVEPEVTVTGVERCLKRYFVYTRELFKRKRTSYALPYDFSSLSGAVDDAVSFGAECVESVVSGNIDADTFSRSFNEK